MMKGKLISQTFAFVLLLDVSFSYKLTLPISYKLNSLQSILKRKNKGEDAVNEEWQSLLKAEDENKELMQDLYKKKLEEWKVL